MLIYSYAYFRKKKRQRRMSRMRVGFSLCVIMIGVVLSQIGGTNAYFSDRAEMSNITFAAGTWIPTLTMAIDPGEPDGSGDMYHEAPCVQFDVDIDNTTIHYAFHTADDVISDTVDPDVCVYPPEGESRLAAYAVNNKNDKWTSTVLTKNFNVQIISRGDVVINELMWMGAFDDKKDEWIELRNMTDVDIDLSGFRIEGAGQGHGGHIQIPNGYTIKAHDYFLITRKKWNKTAIGLDKDLKKDEGYAHVSGIGLQNVGEELVLQDAHKNVIDIAWKNSKMWPDGFDGFFLHLSMERDLDPGDGTEKSNWHTCIDKKCNDEAYWRKEGLNFGTPGKQNSQKISFGWSVGDSEFEKEITKFIRANEGVVEDVLEELDDDPEEKKTEREEKQKKKDEIIKGEELKMLPAIKEGDGAKEESNTEDDGDEDKRSVKEMINEDDQKVDEIEKKDDDGNEGADDNENREGGADGVIEEKSLSIVIQKEENNK